MTNVFLIFLTGSFGYADWSPSLFDVSLTTTGGSSRFTAAPSLTTHEIIEKNKTDKRVNKQLENFNSAYSKFINLINLKNQAFTFIKENQSNLIKDISRGHGETLNTLTDLIQCDKDGFTNILKNKYFLFIKHKEWLESRTKEFYDSDDPNYDRCQSLVYDPRFYTKCTGDTLMQDNILHIYENNLKNSTCIQNDKKLTSKQKLNRTIDHMDTLAFYDEKKSVFDEFKYNRNLIPNFTDFAIDILAMNNLSKVLEWESACIHNNPRLCKYYFSASDDQLLKEYNYNLNCENDVPSRCEERLTEIKLSILQRIEDIYPKED